MSWLFWYALAFGFLAGVAIGWYLSEADERRLRRMREQMRKGVE